MAKNGIDNLIPLHERTEEEQKEMRIKGGIASGEARRKKKQLREELEILLELDNAQEKICTALLMQAKRGNVKAFEVLRDTVGQKPVDKVEVTENISPIIEEVEQYVEGKK